MLWEKFEDILRNSGILVSKEKTVIGVKKSKKGFNVSYIDKDGEIFNEETKNIFFSNPLLEFINILDSDVPNKVLDSAKSLKYRNHISVHVTVDKKLFDDNWIYIHSPNLEMARIADFSNFSEFMSNKNTYPITIEYFCFENDSIWNNDNNLIIDFALKELKSIFGTEFNVVHSAVSRSAKAYPVIKTGYQEYIENIRDWLSSVPNITAIGRSGMFKYNNQDHAMATGLYAARTLLGNGEYDPWEVNVDGEYHEEFS